MRGALPLTRGTRTTLRKRKSSGVDFSGLRKGCPLARSQTTIKTAAYEKNEFGCWMRSVHVHSPVNKGEVKRQMLMH